MRVSGSGDDDDLGAIKITSYISRSREPMPNPGRVGSAEGFGGRGSLGDSIRNLPEPLGNPNVLLKLSNPPSYVCKTGILKRSAVAA